MTDVVEVEPGVRLDPTERVDLLLRDLRSSRSGLSTREAQRRLIHVGPNELRRRGGRKWPRELVRQFTHPLALLLWAAAGLAWAVGIVPVAIAIVVVIVINAVFAFAQEQHAEKAVEALAAYLPVRAKVLRDGRIVEIDAADLVPGDVLLDRGRRSSLGRCAASRRRHRDRPVCADRGVDAGVPLRRPDQFTGAAAAGTRPGVQRHDVHRG